MRNRRDKIERGSLLLGVAIAAITAPLSPVFAQTVDGADAGVAANEQGEVQTNEILVTANRREQNIQDIAISVSALGERDIERFNVQSGADLVRLTPGVFVSNAAAGQSQQYSIRGVTQNDFNDIFEGPIAVYYDDTYVPSLQGQVFGTFDLERIEVLKGPQGTLFGKNATGGLVHFIPRKPTREIEGYGEVSYGRFNSVRTEGAVSGPLSDAVRMRASVLYSRQGNYLKNVYPSGTTFIPPIPFGPSVGEDLGGENTLAGRLQFEVDLSDRFHARLTGTAARLRLGTAPYSSRGLQPVFNASGQHIETIALPIGTPDGLGFIAPSPTSSQTGSDFAGDNGYHLRSYDTSLHLTYEFDSFDVVAVSSYKRFDKSIAVDIDGGAVNFLALGTRNISDSFTQEIRMAGETEGGLKWSTGALFANVDADSDIGFLAPRNSILASSFGPGFAAAGIDLINQLEFKNTNYSMFGQVDLPVTSQLNLIVGGRIIREELRYAFDSTAFANSDDFEIETDTALFPLQPSFVGKTNDTLWAGKVNLEYRTGGGTLLYAGVNRGVKGAAFNAKLPDGGPPLAPSEFPYAPETLYSFEAGTKTSLMDGLVRLSAAAFYNDYKDYQTFTLTNASGIISNNDAHAWGVETNANFTFSSAFQGSLALSYTKATVENVAVAAATATAPAVIRDVRPAFAPRFQASGNLSYDLPLEIAGGTFSLMTDASYTSDFFDNIRNFSAQRHDGYVLVNAGVSWLSADKSLKLKAYVRNLFEENYVETAFDIATLCGCSQIQYSKPRWWTVSIRKEF